jgi:hypothetical protein
MRLQHGLLLGAACLLVLSLGLWFVPHAGDPSPPASGSEPLARASAPRPTVQPPPPATPPPTSTAPGGRAPAPTAAAPPSQTPPPATPPVDDEVLPPGEDTRTDRFEPQNGEEPEVRTLLAVGDIRIGAVRGSEIRDEAALKQVLARIGEDLDRSLKHPQGGNEPGFQSVLDSYRDQMAPYMTGEIEMRGPGFTIGTEVGPPVPREKRGWKPRPR